MTKETQGPGPAGDPQIPAGSRDWDFWARFGYPEDPVFDSDFYERIHVEAMSSLDLGIEWGLVGRHVSEVFGS